MSNDKCFGNYKKGSAECIACEYCASCQLFTKTEGRMDSSLGGQDFDSVSEFASELADYSTTPCETAELDEHDTEDIKAQYDFGGFLSYILSLDDYTLGVLSEIIAPTELSAKRLSVAQIARVHKISRQGMHRKTLDMARKSPELASILKCVVMKIRKSKVDFKAGKYRKSTGENVIQAEFNFNE